MSHTRLLASASPLPFALAAIALVATPALAGDVTGVVIDETDGIGLVLGDFGPDYPEGLFVAQDGQNASQAQNFKLVSWANVRAALGLD